MKNNYFLLIMFIPLFLLSQEKGRTFWTPTDNSNIKDTELLKRSTTPSVYTLYNMDFESLKNELRDAPDRDLGVESNTYISFPNKDGKLERYQVYNASVMDKDFAINYPDIQSYVGINKDAPGTIMRFSTTIFGFHAAVYTPNGTHYIDPYTKSNDVYIYYTRKGLTSNIENRLSCLLEDAEVDANRSVSNTSESLRNANDGQLRTFRLALACTQEYANYHINAAGQQAATDAVKRATVLAAMNVTMTRVNGVFERDMSLTMTLVDNTSIIFLAENDGYTDDNANQLIGQNQTIVDANIGTANYDIGHVFTTGGGGLASLGGICFSNSKARGVTGSPNPLGDPFDIDFVAHELGHQYGAPHTFNGSAGNCSGGNRSAATAVEPGSGTTIMAYAGICSPQNVQNNSDDHFHAISIDNMWNRLNQAPICSTNTPNNNTAPTVDAGTDYTIPYGTAFTLNGSATDPDGTALSYCWEQTDIGTVAGVPSATDTNGPQFRSYSPVATGDRTFPRLEDILDDNLTPTWEVMPSVARTMNFALTVRDNATPNGGQTNRDDMTVTLANTGPFRVTAPNTTNESFSSSSNTDITWDVAGTTANGINTTNVNILLSTDGGQNFDTVLAANTPNDGSENITFPSIFEPYCRIKIEAVGNIFFAISKSFSIGATVTVDTTCNTYTTGAISTNIPDGAGANQQGAPVFIPVTVTETTPITDLRVNVDVTHSYIGDLIMQLQPAPGGFANVWARTCNDAQYGNIDVTLKDGEPAIACATPTTGTYAPASPMAAFNGQNPSGTWNLVFVDFYNGDTGVVNEWSIELCTTTTTIVLNTDKFELDNFSLYPNPNNGDFSLSFTSNSGKAIDVNVYDITGHTIYRKSFQPTSTFNEDISLGNLSSGMYMVKVTDQNRSVIKKMIVN